MHPLGKKIGTFGVNWITVLQWYALYALLGWTIAIVTVTNVPNIQYLFPLGAIVIYFVILQILKILRSRLVLYERGVGVQHGKNEQLWRWHQITSVKGKRGTENYRVATPIISYGASHFYSGEVYAFSVGVLRSNTANLADFITSKMIEYQLPQYLKLLAQGQTMKLGNLQVNSREIGNKQQSFRWQDIDVISIDKEEIATVSVEAYSEKRRIRLGVVYDSDRFILRGIVDAKFGSRTLSTLQKHLLHQLQ